MVHIKRVELSQFKSFGGTTQIPLLPGFTVVSGPNGSGKSNILDALLFALSLASSKGMRAERLPDLVNHKQVSSRSTVVTSVTVTFDLSEGIDENNQNGAVATQEISNGASAPENGANPQPQDSEWTVTRRLRVTKEGNYSSTYYINGEPCTVSQLHSQLNRLRIYPEGYNVVLQGDVTRIITMNSRERRQIIDELAGVAEFDRKIDQVRKTLESVREREERCEIIKEELSRNCDRLAADRIKAEKYQKLKAQIQEKQQWEVVLIWRSLQQQEKQLETEIATGESQAVELSTSLSTLDKQISQAQEELEQLNTRVKALGEDEQLAVAAQLATQEAQREQLQQRQQELIKAIEDNKTAFARTEQEINQYKQKLTQTSSEKQRLATQEISSLTQECDRAQQILTQSREKANEIASASQAWVQEQTNLTHKISAIQQTLNPQRTEQAQLQERSNQIAGKLAQGKEQLQKIEPEITNKKTNLTNISAQISDYEQKIQTLAKNLAIAQQESQIQQDTKTRLLTEQRDKQRQLDKLEATNQAQQEAQGTYATKIILSANIPGVWGLVAQLGQVDPRYQLALETAAGSRLGHVVVEDDSVAAAGIELLKHKRAGRATFLPLNKIRPPRLNDTVVLRYAQGFVAPAVDLIDCEPRYQTIFAYIFGNTLVFATLNDARPHLGKQRLVTLEGDLLESSGAMTGGSVSRRSTLHFGTATTSESAEMQELRRRLQEIELILERCDRDLEQKQQTIAQTSQELTTLQQTRREQQLRQEQLQQDIERLEQQKSQLDSQIQQAQQEKEAASQRLQELAIAIPQQEAQLKEQQQNLEQLEASQTHSEWQQMRQLIKVQEADLQSKQEALRRSENKLQELENQCLRLEEKIEQSRQQLQQLHNQQQQNKSKQTETSTKLSDIEKQIVQTQQQLQQLSAQLGEAKQKRDCAEANLRQLQDKQQQQSWQQQKLQATQQERKAKLQQLQAQLQTQAQELPNPLPEIPLLTDDESATLDEQLEKLQNELKRAQKRLQAMEPVNMLALEEYEQTQARLQELSEKLATIAAERTELLLRIENFTTLRFRAFKEAFDAVNENFQGIFATLSQGDGYLGLDDPEDPFSGGLNLIAHPKGKPVQRLSSMSGGEKSLTALSFIFALQRYRPSPFYAFDEVDMFLDGANVERLARMIKKQAQQAQFIVVSLRRPMIESAQRTIGVTQARGAYTQVLGIKL